MNQLSATWFRVPQVIRYAIALALIAATPFLIEALQELIYDLTGDSFGLLSQVNKALIYVVLALGLNIVVGFSGLLDLGYAAFFALGAYTFGILTWPNHSFHATFFEALPISVVVAALFGIMIGAPTLRLRGDYLAIVTLAFGEIIPVVIRNMGGDFTVTMPNIPLTRLLGIADKAIIEDFNITNGTEGLNPLGRPDFSFFERLFNLDSGTLAITSDPRPWYFAIVLAAALVLFSANRLEHSRLGRAWKAIREDETAADFMGVDPVRTKLLAFALGASFSGLAGVVFASMLGSITQEFFRFQVSIFLLIIVILSGQGNVYGVLIGGLIISLFDGVLLAQILPAYVPKDFDLQSWRWVFFGAGLVVFMLFRPQGLFPPRVREGGGDEEQDLVLFDKTPPPQLEVTD